MCSKCLLPRREEKNSEIHRKLRKNKPIYSQWGLEINQNVLQRQNQSAKKNLKSETS